MDLKFFHLLESIAAAEQKYDFQTQNYDIATLELKYPQNVITVAPPAPKVPPRRPPPGETRMTKLSDAVRTALRRAANGGANGRIGCSIVVHEGVYVDAFQWYPQWKLPDGFLLEIVVSMWF